MATGKVSVPRGDEIDIVAESALTPAPANPAASPQAGHNRESAGLSGSLDATQR
jgi:hypothetical protein